LEIGALTVATEGAFSMRLVTSELGPVGAAEVKAAKAVAATRRAERMENIVGGGFGKE